MRCSCSVSQCCYSNVSFPGASLVDQQLGSPIKTQDSAEQLAQHAVLVLDEFGVRFEGPRGFDHRHHRWSS